MSESKKNKTPIFENEQQVLMYYHSTLRNIGLFTSVGLAALLGSTPHLRKKRGVYKLEGFIILLLSIVFLTMTLFIGKSLYNNIIKSSESLEKDFSDLTFIPYYIYYIDLFLLIGACVLMIRHVIR